MDPEIDFAAMSASFDTYLVGRKTFDAMVRMGSVKPPRGIQTIVFSRSMTTMPHAGIVLSADAVQTVTALKAKPGKDIALFGGGELFRSLLAAGLVDRVEVSVIPVLLGGGIPLLPSAAPRLVEAAQAASLREDGHRKARVRNRRRDSMIGGEPGPRCSA